MFLQINTTEGTNNKSWPRCIQGLVELLLVVVMEEVVAPLVLAAGTVPLMEAGATFGVEVYQEEGEIIMEALQVAARLHRDVVEVQLHPHQCLEGVVHLEVLGAEIGKKDRGEKEKERWPSKD